MRKLIDPVGKMERYRRSIIKRKEYSQDPNRRARKDAVKQWYQQLKASMGCNQCPENNPICLDFHHLQPRKKKRTVAFLAANGFGQETILIEINMCQLLCANCYRKVHRPKPKFYVQPATKE